MSQKVTQKFGKYEITGELGQGGMGVVYKARDPVIGRMVALKTLTAEVLNDPELLKRFYREAQSAGSLQHPNIVTIYDMGDSEGRPYIAMEYVEGESLQKIIARRQPLPLAVKLKIISQFCQGLDHAHKHGVIHRDIKPGNILLRRDGAVKVVDFGIAHLDSTTLTKTGVFMGTVNYSSPEQLNDGRVDARSDLWSVAVVMYEFLSGHKPFEGANFATLISKILNTEPEPLNKYLPDAPPALVSLVSRCLEKDPQKRPQTLEELIAALTPIEAELRAPAAEELARQAQELRSKGELTEAQDRVQTLLLLDSNYPGARTLMAELSSAIQRMEASSRLAQIENEAEKLLGRGECEEALKLLSEALRMDPRDTRALSLQDRAVREQQRQKEARDAFSAAHQAFKQGDLTAAETGLRKVIELDPHHSRAAGLLEIIHQDRETRARNFDLKEALWDAEAQLKDRKADEAVKRLSALQTKYPENAEVLALLKSAREQAAAQRQSWLDGQLTAAGQLLETQEFDQATRVLAAVRKEFPQNQRAQQMLAQAEKATAPRLAAVQPSPPPVRSAAVPVPQANRSRLLPLAIVVVVVLAAVAAALFYYLPRTHHAAPAAATPQQLQLERTAQQLQQQGKPVEALALWSALATQPGPLQSEASRQIDLIEKQSTEEKDLFAQAQTAQSQKQWSSAIGLYQRVAALGGDLKSQALQSITNVKALQSGQDLSALERVKFAQAQGALRRHDLSHARDYFQQVVNLDVPGSLLLPKARQQLADLNSELQQQQDFNAAVTLENGGQLTQAEAKFQSIVTAGGPLSAQAQSRLQQIQGDLTQQEKQKAQGEALQANLAKLKDLEARGRFSEARALANTIGKQGGNLAALESELSQQQGEAFQSLVTQYDQAASAKDIPQLQRLASEFRNFASQGGANASAASNYASEEIPNALKQLTASERAVAPPAPKPAALVPQVAVLTSSDYQPWRGPVRRGQLLPEYNIEGGLKAVNLALPPVEGAPAGSVAIIKINIDEAGNVTPDHVINDTSGQGPALLDACKSWKFRPPTVRGKSVRTSVSVKVTF